MNALRAALRIFSGKKILNFGFQEGAWAVNNMCRFPQGQAPFLKQSERSVPSKKLPRQPPEELWILFITRMRRPDIRHIFYFTNFATARATIPPRMPETRNSATPCTPTSSTTNMKGFAAPLTDTRFCT